MKIIKLISFVLLTTFSLNAQTNEQEKKHKTKVFLLGVFHFDNPGMDITKTKDTDILSVKSQKEIQEVVNIIANTNPQKIFMEGKSSYQPITDSLYKVYLKNGLPKYTSEDVQIGFRLMKKLNLPKSYCVDEDGDFPADSLMKTWDLKQP
jgi:hypothetical protein